MQPGRTAQQRACWLRRRRADRRYRLPARLPVRADAVKRLDHARLSDVSVTSQTAAHCWLTSLHCKYPKIKSNVKVSYDILFFI